MDFVKQRKDIECVLINKAMKDKKFEELLLSDPFLALKEIGVTIPEEYKLKVIREAKGELTLVLPAATHQDELSELELLNAVGGSANNCNGGSLGNG